MTGHALKDYEIRQVSYDRLKFKTRIPIYAIRSFLFTDPPR